MKILISIDTEALPARADESHVEHLIWGRFNRGTAGIKEMAALSTYIGVPFLFFLDMAGALGSPAAFREIASYLRGNGQEVELHFHPEILGKNFWESRTIYLDGLRQDLFSEMQAFQVLSLASKVFRNICGKSASAYRAGSFRWNRATLDAMRCLGIGFSFNNCHETAVKDNYRTYARPGAQPFLWSNGIVEIPCGEPQVDDDYVHLRYPRKLPDGFNFIDIVREAAKNCVSEGILVILLHSWSFLERDAKSGYYYYRDQKKLEHFATFLNEAKKEFELVSFESLKQSIDPKSLCVESTSHVPLPNSV